MFKSLASDPEDGGTLILDNGNIAKYGSNAYSGGADFPLIGEVDLTARGTGTNNTSAPFAFGEHSGRAAYPIYFISTVMRPMSPEMRLC